LEFKLLADPELTMKKLDQIDKLLLGEGFEVETDEADTTALAGDTTATGADAETAIAETAAVDEEDEEQKRLDSIRDASLTDDQKVEKWRKEHPFQSLFQFSETGLFATVENRPRIQSILKRYDVQTILNDEISFGWGNDEREVEGQVFLSVFAMKAKPEMTGEVITNALAQPDPQGMAGAIVTMKMDTEGAREWARITGENVQKPIAIVLDDVVFSTPVVRQKIIGGDSQIEGMEDMQEARMLEIVLKAGALPAPVDIIEERTIGPSLGEDSITKGFYSFVVGIGLVMIFMVIWYRTAGIAADMAVIFNMLFILGILAGFKATLTLPGIAGLLLTVGMAVDANVLINERVREEFGLGKTLRAAIDAGYSRALPAIIDSNITTFITCIILYQFGSGPVKGFALTLMIGIICSLFTAIVMTRVYFEMILDKKPDFIKFG